MEEDKSESVWLDSIRRQSGQSVRLGGRVPMQQRYLV